jgi:hypothetical protein
MDQIWTCLHIVLTLFTYMAYADWSIIYLTYNVFSVYAIWFILFELHQENTAEFSELLLRIVVERISTR